MSRKLFVANFPYAATEEVLRDLFSEHGEVEEIKIIYDRETGRSRGFGFVMMDKEESCQAAVDALSGYDMDGRALAVRIAEPRNRVQDRSDGEVRHGPKRFALARNRPRRFQD